MFLASKTKTEIRIVTMEIEGIIAKPLASARKNSFGRRAARVPVSVPGPVVFR
jgi:hypothetical protein